MKHLGYNQLVLVRRILSAWELSFDLFLFRRQFISETSQVRIDQTTRYFPVIAEVLVKLRMEVDDSPPISLVTERNTFEMACLGIWLAEHGAERRRRHGIDAVLCLTVELRVNQPDVSELLDIEQDGTRADPVRVIPLGCTEVWM